MFLLFAAIIAAPSPVSLEVNVPGSPAEVWRAWTTEAGLTSFLAPQARIELKPGGAFEPYFVLEAPTGSRGAEGCTIVSLRPTKELRFTWNFPPTIPSLRAAGAKTTVTITFSKTGRSTRVALVQDGWEDGEDWLKGRAYFEHAWALVLARLAHRFRVAPLDWSHPWQPSTPERLAFLKGAWRLEDGPALHEELWTLSPTGLLGAYRVSKDGRGVMYEIATIERDGDELVLRQRLYAEGLSSSRRAESLPMTFLLEAIDEGWARFRGTGPERNTTLVYARDGDDGLEVAVAKKASEETFRFTRVPPGRSDRAHTN